MVSSGKRIIIKLSGEVLGGDNQLFVQEKIDKIANILVDIHRMGYEVGVVIGAGNIARGRNKNPNLSNVKADQIGMLGTVMNCLYMADVINHMGVKAQVLSAIEMPKFAEVYNTDKAIEYLKDNRIVFFAAGSGNPFFTTDTAVVLRAIEVEADTILFAKAINGVYTDDPRKNPDAKFIPEISYEKALSMNLEVIDTSAFLLCAQYKVPTMHLFELKDPENMLKVLAGERIGSILYPEK